MSAIRVDTRPSSKDVNLLIAVEFFAAIGAIAAIVFEFDWSKFEARLAGSEKNGLGHLSLKMQNIEFYITVPPGQNVRQNLT